MCFILFITFSRDLTSAAASFIQIGDDTLRANVSLSSPTMDMDEDLFDDVVADKTYTPPRKEFNEAIPVGVKTKKSRIGFRLNIFIQITGRIIVN